MSELDVIRHGMLKMEEQGVTPKFIHLNQLTLHTVSYALCYPYLPAKDVDTILGMEIVIDECVRDDHFFLSEHKALTT